MRTRTVQDDSASKADIAYSLLKGRILDQTYVPGYRIVVDQFARETGLSNNPVREAVRRLEAEGWVEVVRNVGARVSAFAETDRRITLELIARLEGFATALSVAHLTAEDLVAARALDARMVEALDLFDPVGFGSLNREFHAIFHERCGDAHLRSLLASELQRFDIIRRSVHSSVPGRARTSIDEHERLLDLIEADAGPAEVEAFARQHKLNGLVPVADRPAT